MKVIKYGAAAVIIGGLAAALWALGTNYPSAALLRSDDPKLVAQGATVYKAECASCHGDNLEGQPNWRIPGSDGLMPAPPHDASGHTWHHSDDVLFGITKLGLAKFAGLKDHKSAMPIYDGVLSDDEIIAVLSYIKSRWPMEVQKMHDKVNAQAKKAAKK